MKVKIFSKRAYYLSSLSKMSSLLEEDVNAWLAMHTTIKIIDIKQSSCGGSMDPSKHVISIWYERSV